MEPSTAPMSSSTGIRWRDCFSFCMNEMPGRRRRS
ncbi:Uncharacterised protein [Bordetella pertussis]|nr:Uncharacterised protein [Bordetella pertussis]